MGRNNKDKREELSLEERAVHALEKISHSVESIAHSLQKPSAISGTISQIENIGGIIMGVPVGITLGQVAFFQVTLSPLGSSIDPATALWTCSDPAATLTPSADGLTVAVATLTTDTLSSLQMGFGATGATVNGVPGVAFTVPALSVPLSGGGTSGAVSATGGSIAQIAAPAASPSLRR